MAHSKITPREPGIPESLPLPKRKDWRIGMVGFGGIARGAHVSDQNFVSDNLMVVVADFGEGLTGHILHSELLRSSLAGVQCRIDGHKGSMTFDFASNLVLQSTELGKEAYTLDTSGLNFISSFAGSMGNFLMALETDTEPMVSGRRNLSTITNYHG